jgi:hypothetical protein
MKDLIRKILKEYTKVKNLQKIGYNLLSEDDKEKIKKRGNNVFVQLVSKIRKDDKLKNLFKESGLHYGVPDKEYLIKNINDAKFALDNLPLQYNTRDKLTEKKDEYDSQLKSIDNFEKGEQKGVGPWVVFFQEESKNGNMGWSEVNLYNDNIKIWITLINDWMKVSEENFSSISELIDYYFNLDNGERALEDLKIAMLNREKHSKETIRGTWGGGQQVEQEFKSRLLSLGFRESDIRMFSGGKNVVDNVGIDLAIRCNDRWIPIQVKSNSKDASTQIPYQGFSTFPFDNTFILIEKINNNRIQKRLEDLCSDPNRSTIKSTDKGRPHFTSDYFGSMGIKT